MPISSGDNLELYVTRLRSCSNAMIAFVCFLLFTKRGALYLLEEGIFFHGFFGNFGDVFTA